MGREDAGPVGNSQPILLDPAPDFSYIHRVQPASVSEAQHRTPGQRLRDLRVTQGLTQIQLAVAASVASGTVSFAERDERYPSPLRQERIARALGVQRSAIWPEQPREAAS